MAASLVPLIGVFDSGVGGVSVLRALRQRMPQVPLHYFADAAFAPYGDRSEEEIVRRSLRVAEHLKDSGAAMIVVACNTATTAAIRALRERWPGLPFVGVEPGVKPAVAQSVNGRIAVVATRRTIASERLRSLVAEHGAGRELTLHAWPGLVDAIERGDDAQVQRLLESFCEPLRAAQVDTVVLGCTHYPFVADRVSALLGPGTRLIDTADAVAQRASTVWQGLGGPSTQPALKLQSSGDPAVLEAVARRWLSPDAVAEHASV